MPYFRSSSAVVRKVLSTMDCRLVAHRAALQIGRAGTRRARTTTFAVTPTFRSALPLPPQPPDLKVSATLIACSFVAPVSPPAISYFPSSAHIANGAMYAPPAASYGWVLSIRSSSLRPKRSRISTANVFAESRTWDFRSSSNKRSCGTARWLVV